MDYGKLAYLKAVDLEERLGKEKSSDFGITVKEFCDLPSGRQQLMKIYGEGEIAVFINSTQSGVFYVDGVKISEGDNVFFKLTDGGEIAVESSGIAKIRVMIIGNIISSENPGTLFADYNGSMVMYIVFNQGIATMKYFEDSEHYQILTGPYYQGDVCLFDDYNFLVALIDETGHLEIICSNGTSNVYEIRASRVAVSADASLIRIAFIRDGELYYSDLKDLSSDTLVETKIPFPGVIDDVRFVKKSGKLLFSSGGKCYVKDLGFAVNSSNKLYVEFSMENL